MGFWKNVDHALAMKAVVPFSPAVTHRTQKGTATPKNFSDGRSAIKDGYEASGWVYGLVRRKQSMVSGLEWLVRTKLPDGTIEEDMAHDAARLVNMMTPDKVDRCWSMSRNTGFLSVTGNAFFGKYGTDSDNPDPTRFRSDPASELRVESPVGVTPLEDGTGWVLSYRVEGAGDEWNPITVIHVMLPSLTTPLWGMSELQALAVDVDVDIAGSRWNLDSFGSGGMPSHIMVDNTTTRGQLEEVRDKIDERFRDKGRERTPWVIPGAEMFTGQGTTPRAAIELHKLGMTAQEMDFLNGAGFTRDKIYAVLGFHPADASNERATHDNARAAQRQAWETGAMPLINAFSSAFTMSLLTVDERRSGMSVVPDLRSIPALQADRGVTAKAFRDLTEGGMTVDDAARYLGLKVGEHAEYGIPPAPSRAAVRPAQSPT